ARAGGGGGCSGVRLALPADTVKSIIAELKENGAVTRGWLGVEVEPVTPEIAVRSGLGRARGALVGAGPKGKKAANVALDAGDVIISLNGEPVRDFRALARLTAAMRPGTAVEVGVLRRGEAKTVAARLGKLPDEPLQAADSVGRPTSRREGANCHARLCRL